MKRFEGIPFASVPGIRLEPLLPATVFCILLFLCSFCCFSILVLLVSELTQRDESRRVEVGGEKD